MTPIEQKLESLNNKLAGFENKLNNYGYVLIISIVSGSVRFVYGSVQVISGVACIALAATGVLGPRKKVMGLVSIYPLHGVGNMVRGLVEIIPGTLIPLAIYQCVIGGIKYPGQKIQEFVDGDKYTPAKKMLSRFSSIQNELLIQDIKVNSATIITEINEEFGNLPFPEEVLARDLTNASFDFKIITRLLVKTCIQQKIDSLGIEDKDVIEGIKDYLKKEILNPHLELHLTANALDDWDDLEKRRELIAETKKEVEELIEAKKDIISQMIEEARDNSSNTSQSDSESIEDSSTSDEEPEVLKDLNALD